MRPASSKSIGARSIFLRSDAIGIKLIYGSSHCSRVWFANAPLPMLTIFALPSQERWDARTATNTQFHCAGCITAKTIKSGMKSNGGNATALILSRSLTDCGVSAEVSRAVSSNTELHGFGHSYVGAAYSNYL
jgi:hypothetical protein